jgi:uncharacterized protein (DUF362 family)
MVEKPKVVIKRCRFDLEDDEIERRVSEAIDLLGGLPSELESASKILLKPNLGYKDARRHKGRLIALTEPCVVRAVLRRIREVNDNEVIISDGPPYSSFRRLIRETGYEPLIREFDVKVLNSNDKPYETVEVSGGGTIMRRYVLNKEIASVDATVSIAKMKVHLFAGITLCMKNLFGLPPEDVYGAPRFYLHYPVRLPRCLVDLTSIFNPSLCVIEGLIGGDLQEWYGPPVESNVIIVGDNPVATDAVGTAVMGFDPTEEFPDEPFLWDVNHLNIASSYGLGLNDLSQIEILGDTDILESGRRLFHKKYAAEKPPEMHLKTRRYVSEQAMRYVEMLPELLETREGEYVGILDGQVAISSRDIRDLWKKFRKFFIDVMTFRGKGGEEKYKIPFIKKVMPLDENPEIMDAYRED